MNMALLVEPSIQLAVHKERTPPFNTCADYGEGCLSVRTLLVKKVHLVVVEFTTEEQAFKEALRLDGFYLGSWLFDEAAGEPVLEKFVEKAFQAKRPQKELKD